MLENITDRYHGREEQDTVFGYVQERYKVKTRGERISDDLEKIWTKIFKEAWPEIQEDIRIRKLSVEGLYRPRIFPVRQDSTAL